MTRRWLGRGTTPGTPGCRRSVLGHDTVLAGGLVLAGGAGLAARRRAHRQQGRQKRIFGRNRPRRRRKPRPPGRPPTTTPARNRHRCANPAADCQSTAVAPRFPGQAEQQPRHRAAAAGRVCERCRPGRSRAAAADVAEPAEPRWRRNRRPPPTPRLHPRLRRTRSVHPVRRGSGEWSVEGGRPDRELGRKRYQGKTLLESVNVIIVDPHSTTKPAQAPATSTTRCCGRVPGAVPARLRFPGPHRRRDLRAETHRAAAGLLQQLLPVPQ